MCGLLVAAALLLAGRGLGSAVRPEVSAGDMGVVVFASVVFRHGDRAPLFTYPTDPYKEVHLYWPRGLGQLTEVGEERQYELGEFLRSRYDHMLLPAYYDNQTYVRSTAMNRALVSAEATLAGLYPAPRGVVRHVKFQPVPVHTRDLSEDTLMAPHYACPRIKELVEVVRQSPELSCVRQLTAALREEVARFTAEDQFSAALYDTLFIQDAHNLTLPDWVHAYYPSPLKSIYLLEGFIALAGTTRLQRLNAGPLLEQVACNTQLKMGGALEPDRSLYLYSGHDFNVVALLQALGVFDGRPVPYSAAVLFELRRRGSHHYVTVSYRNSSGDEPRLLKLPGCNALCPAGRFLQLVRPLVPEDWRAECEGEVRPRDRREKLRVPRDAIPAEWSRCFAAAPCQG